ncbi:unnamed protein product, partial [Rotaria sordida]
FFNVNGIDFYLLVPQTHLQILANELTIRGLMVMSYDKEFDTALNEMAPLIKKGDLKFKETLYEGFEKVPEAFIGLFKGENIGKAIVKASNYP